MGARRRVGPAAVAAVLIGLGLALHRPRLVADLRPGTRGVKPPAPNAAAPARTFAGPAAAAGGAPRTAESDVAASAPLPDLDPSTALEEGSLRDAPADHGAPSGLHDAAARGGSFSGAGPERDRLRAPSAAELDPLTSPRTPQKSGQKAKAATSPSDPRAPLRPGDVRARPRGAPLASGPADAHEESAGGGENGSAVDSRSGAARGGPSWTRRRTRAFPLFRPPRREAGPKRASARRRVRPLLLSKLLGRGALRPPASSLAAPDLSRLSARKPPLLPDGSPSPARPFELDLLEAHDPTKTAPSCRRRGAHWDAGPLWHDGAARGVVADERWLWLWKQDARWWALGDARQPPLLHHQQLWWSKQRGVWFALHDGELWSWRLFSDWDATGLLRLADGVEIVYSADFTKVAVITPGEGAVLYDAATGAELGEWLESEMPPRRPRAPAGLRLPRGI